MLHYWYTNDPLMIQHWYTTDTLTDTLLAHYWHTTDTLLTHYLYTTEPVLAQHWHQYCSSIETVLPLYGISADSPPGNWHPELFFWHSLFVLALKANYVHFLEFWVFTMFSTLAWGRAMPPPIPPPPWAKCRLPRGKACTFAQGGGWMGGGIALPHAKVEK